MKCSRCNQEVDPVWFPQHALGCHGGPGADTTRQVQQARSTRADPFENTLKDELDPERLRDTIVGLIWRDETDGLSRLCDQQITMPFFLEKVITEIASGNHWNDVLFLIARRLIEVDPTLGIWESELEKKRKFVRNQSGGREILAPFVHEELSAAEFMDRLELIMGTGIFLGLDALVAENPNTTASFIRQAVAHHGGKMDSETRYFQLLCEIAMAHRNHHHQSNLLDLLEKVGGKLNLLKTADDIGSITIMTGPSTLDQIHEEARHARLVLNRGDLETALKLYSSFLPRIETFLGRPWVPTGDWEYANALLFSAVLLALKNNAVEAQGRLLKCMKIRFMAGLGSYGALLFLNIEHLQKNAETVRNAFPKVGNDVGAHLAFDCFFEQASGHSFSEVNQSYDRFSVIAGDRAMDEALSLSEQLLREYEAKRNLLVPFSLCEHTVRLFRACHFSMVGEVTRAEQEFLQAYRGEESNVELRSGFERLLANPENILTRYFGD